MLGKGIRFLLESSGFLIAGALGALIWANSDYATYHQTAHALEFVVNEVLMCFFFALAAKEIRESILPGGSLASPRRALLPLLATVGGMAGPALLYVAGCGVIGRSDLMRGWAIPCATDIAFSYLAARFVFGRNHPAIPFLLLLAIADDAGGLVILAVFYPTGALDLLAFSGLVGVALVLGAGIKQLGVISFWPYLIGPGALSWLGFYWGGIHPALALVPVIFIMPHERLDVGLFAEEDMRERVWPVNVKTFDDTLNRLEHWCKHPVELILGLFGLVNAGVSLTSVGTTAYLVAIGLLVGKPIGIVLCTGVGRMFGLVLPAGMTLRDVLVLGVTAGTGFTVALFVATMAFPEGAALEGAKMGALASLVAMPLALLAGRVLNIQKR